MTDLTCDVITQLRKQRKATITPMRLEILSASPYPTYTQEQLNMRRKAEILQYQPKKQSTQQNGLTKSQKFAQIVNGASESINTDTTCNDGIIYTPSTSSGVPGAVQNLYLDPSIPLYNYPSERTYNLIKTTDDRKWNVTYETDVVCDIVNVTESSLASIYIRDGIDENYYTFGLSIPVNIVVSGKNASRGYDLDFSRNVVDIALKSATVYVYYNDISLNTSGISKQVIPSVDISQVRDLSLNTIGTVDNTDFSANVFSGELVFGNIQLYTVTGFVYDFKVSINGNLDVRDTDYIESDYFSSMSYTVVLNSTVADSSSNCIVSEPYSTTTARTFSISGTASGVTTTSSSSWTVGSSGSSGSSGNVDISTLAASAFDSTYANVASTNYAKTGIASGNTSYYGSKTTISLDSTYITIISDGDPYPAKSGDTFSNDLTVIRQWAKVPNPLTEQNFNYKFTYRGGTNTEASTPPSFFTTMGVQGIFLNGVALYNPSSGTGTVPGTTIRGNGQYALNAVFFEEQYGIDLGGGHPSPEGNIVNGKQGQYHYHDGMFLTSGAWNNSTFASSNAYFFDTSYNGDYIRHTDGHSKIVGFCFDGYPIYGPYGYVDATNTSSGTQLMTSSYVTKIAPFSGRPYSYTATSTSTDDSIIYTLSAGAFIDDYEYSTGTGTLDEYNGRYGKTPDYPNGTYAYFIIVDDNDEPVFPYIIGSKSKQTRTVTNYGYSS